jgi:hypothetical protein
MGVVFVPDLSAFRRSLQAAQQALARGTANPELAAGFRKAGAEYLAYTRRGFEARTFSGFAPLKPATQAQRKRQGFSPSRPILVRSGELFRALYPDGPSNLFQLLPDGIRTGIADGTIHKPYADGSGGRTTVKQIAYVHQRGAGHIPQRAIFYSADAPTLAYMRNAIQQAVSVILAKAA